MLEVTGDIWEKAIELGAGAIVITTNASIKTNGEAVMGRGVALQAKTRWPELPQILAAIMADWGSHVYWLGDFNLADREISLLSFPVKQWWWEKADLNIVAASVLELDKWAIAHQGFPIVLPRPGCGNGKLNWDDVRPILTETLIDNRYIIVDNGSSS